MEDLNPTLVEAPEPRDDSRDDTDACVRLGRLVRQARERRGLSLANVAEALQTSYQRLQRIERGDTDPGFSLVTRLVIFFEIDPVRLIYGQKVASIRRRGDLAADGR